MTYAQQIKKLKKDVESWRDVYTGSVCSSVELLKDLIDRTATLSLAENKRQQHENMLNAIRAAYPVGTAARIVRHAEIASLSPGEEGKE